MSTKMDIVKKKADGRMAAYLLVLLLVLQLTSIGWAQDTVSSMIHLKQLVDAEARIAIRMSDYLQRERQRLDDIQELLEENNAPNASTDQDVYHPVGAYQLIKKWFIVTQKVADRSNEEVLQTELAADQIPMVSSADSYGAALALLRLQRVYNLSTEDMAQGNVRGKQVSPLNEWDFSILGQLAMVLGEFGLSAQWLERSIPASPQKKHADVLSEIAKANFYVGDYESSLRAIERAVHLDPMNQTLHHLRAAYFMRNASFYEEHGSAPLSTANTWQREMPDWRLQYEALCRGDQVEVAPDRLVKQHCRYRKTRIPIIVVKEEVMSTDPWISLFYDVITDAEVDHLKNAAIPRLHRAMVGDPAKAQSTDERVSKVAWLWDYEDGVIPKLSAQIDIFTGLSTTYRPQYSSAEPFQVINYGLGGQYEPHVDYYEVGKLIRGEEPFLFGSGPRITTFLYYLSDVEAGGSTVFPKIGVRVPVVKNAAAFWFNIKKNGDFDPNTQHAGCPVLMGEKWVANKWIRENGQVFRRKCGLTSTAEEDGY